MGDLLRSVLGRTGLEVTKLGYGTGELRNPPGIFVEPADAEAILHEVLDSGINYLDTAPDYGPAEERVGQFLAHRRDEFFLASKCGCVPDGTDGFGAHVFTPENVRAIVERSLVRLRTDHLDVLQVHASPSRQALEDDGTIEEMARLRDEGKVRFLGMSGILPHLSDHIAMGVFDVFMIPYSGVEREHEDLITQAARAGAGVVIRGGVAKGLPSAEITLALIPENRRDADPQWAAAMAEQREGRRTGFERAGLDDLLDGATPVEFLLRFTISHPDMHTTVVGTAIPQQLRDNLAAARKGPLPPDVYEEAKRRLA